mgnify:CR=1 FL=1
MSSPGRLSGISRLRRPRSAFQGGAGKPSARQAVARPERVGAISSEGTELESIARVSKSTGDSAYLPKIYQAERVDQVMDMGQAEAEHVMRRLAREEGIFCGVSSGGSVAGMLRLSQQVENAVLVAIICDRGDRYLSTGVFNAEGNAEAGQ